MTETEKKSTPFSQEVGSQAGVDRQYSKDIADLNTVDKGARCFNNPVFLGEGGHTGIFYRSTPGGAG